MKYIEVVLKRINKYVLTAKNMYILICEETVYERDTKTEKVLLDGMNSKMVIAMLALLFHGRAGDNISLLKVQRQKG